MQTRKVFLAGGAWGETHDGTPQQYWTVRVERLVDGPKRWSSVDVGTVVVRCMDDYGLSWSAINLSVKQFGIGQIIATAPSDTSCVRRLHELMKETYRED